MAYQVKEQHKTKSISVKEYKGKLGDAPADVVQQLQANYKELNKFFEDKPEAPAKSKGNTSADASEVK